MQHTIQTAVAAIKSSHPSLPLGLSVSFAPSYFLRVSSSAPSLARQTSSSYSYQEQQRILGLFELTQEFKQQHYLTGLLLTELSAALDMESEG